MEIRTAEGGFETRSAGPYAYWGSSAPPTNGQSLGLAAAGVSISEQSALQLAACWGAVDLISTSIATLPIQQWRKTSTQPVQMEPAAVIRQPWPEITQRDFIVQGSMSQLLRGNLFGRVTARDAKTLYPSQVQLVHPDHARVVRNRDSGQLEVYYWNELVPPDDVTRAMALQVPGAFVGLNPIEYMRNVMGLARAQDLMGGAFFANNAKPSVAITVPGDLDPNDAEAVKNSYNEKFQGINRAYSAIVLTGGMTVEPISMNMADAQFIEQMQFSESVISGRIYRVPPHMLGMVDKDTSWGAGIEQQELGFVRNTLLIWLCRWEDLLSSWLPPNQFVTFDLSQRLRGDTLQRFSAWQIARVSGWMSNLDVLKAEGMPIPTDPDVLAQLSDYAAPLNSAPVKALSGGAAGPGGDEAD